MAEQVPTEGKPWGSAVGLMTACLVTLIGVIAGLEPDVILVRAVIASIVMGVLGIIAGNLLEYLVRDPKRRKTGRRGV